MNAYEAKQLADNRNKLPDLDWVLIGVNQVIKDLAQMGSYELYLKDLPSILQGVPQLDQFLKSEGRDQLLEKLKELGFKVEDNNLGVISVSWR